MMKDWEEGEEASEWLRKEEKKGRKEEKKEERMERRQ